MISATYKRYSKPESSRAGSLLADIHKLQAMKGEPTNELIACEKCNRQFSGSGINAHRAKCLGEKKSIYTECKDCGIVLKRKSMSLHRKKFCKSIPKPVESIYVECEGCHLILQRKSMWNHTRKACGNKPRPLKPMYRKCEDCLKTLKAASMWWHKKKCKKIAVTA